MPEVSTTTLVEHKVFSGVSQSGKPYVKNLFTGADGREYTTFRPEVAQQAVPLLNQPVMVTYEVKQRGQFTNYDLEAVASANGPAAAPVAQPAPSAPAPAPVVFGGSKDDQIARSVAIKLAAETVEQPLENLAQLFAFSDMVARWIVSGDYLEPEPDDAA